MTNSPTHSSAPSLRELPPTPLMLIRERFTTLAAPPGICLPPGWDEPNAAALAQRLLDPHIPADEVDAVWAALIEQARTRDEAAVLVCAGAALPMLHTIASKLCGHWIYRADTEAMVVLAFLEALTSVDVDRPNVAYRLRWATFNRACKPIQERRSAPPPADWFHETARTAHKGEVVGSPSGHPDVLVRQAMDEGVLTAADAGLIIDTRLEHQRLAAVAAETGIGYAALAKRRRRAEQQLEAWLRARITDTQSSTQVEITALDSLTRHRDHTDRQQPTSRMSKTSTAPRVLPMPKSAPEAESTSHEEARRCA